MKHVRRSVVLLAAVIAVAVNATAAAPMRSLTDERSFVGRYQRVPKVSSGTVSETLEINADKTFLWTRTFSDRSPEVVTGIWNVRGQVIVVVLGTRDGIPYPAGQRVVFDRKGKKLKGREFDRTQFGDAELIFQRNDG